MKTLFIRIFALLGFFLASPAFALECYSKDNGNSGQYPYAWTTNEAVCSSALADFQSNSTGSNYNLTVTPLSDGVNCSFTFRRPDGSTGSGSARFVRKPSACGPTPTPSPTPQPTPSPTPKPNPCADKTDSSFSITSFSSSDFHPSKAFMCEGGCAYRPSVISIFTTGTAKEFDSCSVSGQTFAPRDGCTYYGTVLKSGLGKTCDDAYADYMAGVMSQLQITYDPTAAIPTPAPTSGPTSAPTPVGSGTPAPTAPPSTPAPTPLPPGKCKGTANGATVVYDCYNADKDSKTQETKNSDGSTTTSTTTKDTKCIDDACQTTTTTTTTTKDPNGNQVGSTTITGGTTTQTRKSFCEENPKASACVGTPDEGFCEQNPQLSVCKDGKWGAGSCGSEPSCSGDEVQCAQARFAFKSYCESKKTSDLLQDLGEKFSSDSNGGAAMPSLISFYTPSYPDGIAGVWASKKDQFNQTPLATLGARLLPDVGEGGQNPSFTFDLDFGGVMNMGTHTLEIDPNIWAIIRAIVLVSALIYAYKMIFGG